MPFYIPPLDIGTTLGVIGGIIESTKQQLEKPVTTARDAAREAEMNALSTNALAEWDVRSEPSEPYPNPSGIVPLDLVALVLPDPAEAVTKGGIIIPETTQAKQKYHTQKATLVAVGKSCFAEWVEKPTPGQRVLIVQYAGTLIKGKDGAEYRIVRNDDLIAVLEEE